MDDTVWPLFSLRVRTPRLELRYPDDADLVALAEVAARGIHDPTEMPFSVPWTDQPPEQLQRGLLQFHWSKRASLTPQSWWLELVAVVDGMVVGTQAAMADEFPALRAVTTGSWLGREFQGHGIGTEMRAAILHLAFEGLDAVEARTGAWSDNVASLSVTRKLGYEPEGSRRALRRGEPHLMLGFRIRRPEWERTRRDDIELVGVERTRHLLGLE